MALRSASRRPKGFIRVLDEKTLGFADYVGNRQYISTGNLNENDPAFLFLMDCAQRRRVKIWGRARVVTDDPKLLARLMPEGHDARPQQPILFTIEAWDVNCPQHIPQKFDAADVAAAVEKLEHRINELEAENARFRASLRRTSKVVSIDEVEVGLAPGRVSCLEEHAGWCGSVAYSTKAWPAITPCFSAVSVELETRRAKK